jgi:hypothetical protein
MLFGMGQNSLKPNPQYSQYELEKPQTLHLWFFLKSSAVCLFIYCPMENSLYAFFKCSNRQGPFLKTVKVQTPLFSRLLPIKRETCSPKENE